MVSRSVKHVFRHHLMLIWIQNALRTRIVRTTLTLDDELLSKAQALTGLAEKSTLVREALRALIERESARRLALLGGSEPQLSDIPRRQSASRS